MQIERFAAPKHIEAKAGMAGNVEKAVLVLYDQREVVSAGHAEDLSAGLVDAARRILSDAGQLATPRSSGGIKKKYFFVQFNPNRLTLFSGSAHSGAVAVKQVGAQEPQNIVQNIQPAVLTVPLVFDHIGLHNVFRAEGLNRSDRGAGQEVGASIKNMDQAISIRPIVEGLLAAIKNPKTCGVRFAWGDFIFEGTIEAVMADYTVFSQRGEPIRAAVTLQIKQAAREFDRSVYTAFGREAFGRSVTLQK